MLRKYKPLFTFFCIYLSFVGVWYLILSAVFSTFNPGQWPFWGIVLLTLIAVVIFCALGIVGGNKSPDPMDDYEPAQFDRRDFDC